MIVWIAKIQFYGGRMDEIVKKLKKELERILDKTPCCEIPRKSSFIALVTIDKENYYGYRCDSCGGDIYIKQPKHL